MANQRLFVAQVVTAIEEQWFAPGTKGPVIRAERSYIVEQQLFAAMDEDDAYRIVTDWLKNDAFSDAHHDGAGDLTRCFGIGIHELEEVSTLDEFPTAVHKLYGVHLPALALADVDANCVPMVRERNQLEVFRLRRILKGCN